MVCKKFLVPKDFIPFQLNLSFIKLKWYNIRDTYFELSNINLTFLYLIGCNFHLY